MGAGQQITAELDSGVDGCTAQVLSSSAHTLFVEFDGDEPADGRDFESTILHVGEGSRILGPCRYERHVDHPLRRAHDPVDRPPGQGRLIFTTEVFDFAGLGKRKIGTLAQTVAQLPILWERKAQINQAFRDYTADLVYDMQVYRRAFQDVDRGLRNESEASAELIRRVALRSEYPAFSLYFDSTLQTLENVVQSFTKAEHERHGFYFRKHVWDLISLSQFLQRTNLKPRGYAGDSEMMAMIYEHGFRGPSIFARMLHKHPIDTHAAQAVRNRIGLLSRFIRERAAEHSGSDAIRVMSVACGPARELRHVFLDPDLAQRFSFMLLDQDSSALREAQREVDGLSERLGVVLDARVVRESVRTMLRTSNLADSWGRFDFIYSMGLFDYLTPPVARAVMGKLYQLLEPGGDLVIGNFHTQQQTRVYMDYWMDWVLYYRTEEEFAALAADLPGAEFDVTFEETRSQMFIRIKKTRGDA